MIRTVERCRCCSSLDLAGLTVDVPRSEVRWAGDRAALTRSEIVVLECLVMAGGTLVRTQSLIDAVWGWGYRIDAAPNSAQATPRTAETEPCPA